MKTKVSLAAILTCIVFSLTSGPASAGWLFKSNEEKLQESVAKWLKDHILATANDVELQEFMLVDKNAKPTDKTDNAVGFGIVFTIFWQGPVTKDGYLKLFAYYDVSLRTFSKVEVVATNGVLNEDAAKGFGEILGAMFNK